MKHILTGLIFIAVSIIIPIFFQDILTFLVTKLSSGWVFGSIYIRIIVIVFFALGLYALMHASEKLRKLKFIWVFLIAIVPGFGISFIAPIYQFDYGTHTSDLSPENFERLEELTDLTLSENKKIVVFFTTTCPHCKVASKHLGYNIESGQKLEVNAFFPGTPKDAEKFISENNGVAFNHFAINNDELFLELSGGSFPSMFLLSEENKVISHWTGDGINFSCLDYLANEEP